MPPLIENLFSTHVKRIKAMPIHDIKTVAVVYVEREREKSMTASITVTCR